MRRILCVTGLMLLSLAHVGAAQDTPVDLVSGRLVRVHKQNARPMVGRFVSIGSDTVTVALSEGDTVAVPRESITRFDLYMGSKSGAGKGALTGLAIGAAVGAVLGAVSAGSDDGSWYDYSASEWALSGAVGFGLLGAGIGALVGAGQELPRWQATALPTVTVRPDGSAAGGVAIAVRLDF
ncbi:MAG TPA: hypothetical protein VFV65_06960 [Gemmatimonadales bacterium]|nr:hypothetical protein [Gemmatimonadales bacterium]